MTTKTCNTFWGSHGCELPEGHDPEQEHPVHECSWPEYDDNGQLPERALCSQAQHVTDEYIRLRFNTVDRDTWTKWRTVELQLFRNDEETPR